MKSHGHPSERLAHMRVAAVERNKVIVADVRRNPVIGPDHIGSIAFEHLKELTIAEHKHSRDQTNFVPRSGDGQKRADSRENSTVGSLV